MIKIIKYIVVTLLVIFAIIGDVKTALGQDKIEENKIKFAIETSNAWTPTFQLCWNELINLIGTPRIMYVDGNPKLADELNTQPFDKSDLSENSYYISVTKMTQKHKKEIEKAIWDKFNEKSDILDKFEFENVSDNKTNKWFIYSMLLKKFKFHTPYKILDADYFNNTEKDKYKYFGFTKGNIDEKAKETLENGYMENLFYVNDNDFALKIYNKDKTEQMILYLTDSKESFETLYNEILDKNKYKNDYIRARAKESAEKYGSFAKFKFHNYYKIPFMHIDKTYNYNKELANKPIKDKTYNSTGRTWTILKTLQTIKFDMDNEGAKLKSEAAIAVMKNTAVAPIDNIINIDNNYFFDRPFVIFLKETGKTKPYFAARVRNGKFLVKEE
jgi:hypothetical protein